jgi:hypothetical protein
MNGKVLSGPAAVLIIVLFFLPWITVSCDGVPVGEFSGYNLASGTVPDGSDDVFAAGQVEGDPILFAIPLIGFVTLILLGVTIWKSSFETNASWGQIIAAFIGLLILVLEWVQLRGQGDGVFEIVFQPALWGTAVTLIAIGGGAIFDLVLGSKRQRPLAYAAPAQQQRPSPAFPSSPPAYQPPMPPIGDAGHTILDDDLQQNRSYGNETILDDDLFPKTQVGDEIGSETIIDEEYMGSGFDDTIHGNEPTGYETPPLPTATPANLPPTKQSPDRPRKIVWAAGGDDPAPSIPVPPKPTPPPPPAESSVQKTEVLHFTPESTAWLIIGSGERRGEKFQLFSDTTIGRETTNDIVIDDTAMSNVHVRIKNEHGRFLIYDQNSTNGIFIFNTAANRWEKQDAYELNNEDQIKLGRTVLHFMTA